MRRIILRTAEIQRTAEAAIRNLPIDPDHPFEVTIGEYKEKRNLGQNALMWVLLDQISRQAWIGGRQYDAETLNIHFKREFLPEVTAKGKNKWLILPSGDRELALSTSGLNTAEFATYLTQIEAFGAGIGVQFSEHRP